MVKYSLIIEREERLIILKGDGIVMTANRAGYLASAGAPMYNAAKHGIVVIIRATKPELVKRTSPSPSLHPPHEDPHATADWTVLKSG